MCKYLCIWTFVELTPELRGTFCACARSVGTLYCVALKAEVVGTSLWKKINVLANPNEWMFVCTEVPLLIMSIMT